MDVPLRKVTARADFKAGSVLARPHPRSRPGSPTTSLSPSAFHLKAKANTKATLRKLSSSSSLSTPHSINVPTSPHSRPGSPLRPSRMLQNGAEPSGSPKAPITARPTSRSRTSPFQTNPSQESRQRALTAASTKLKPTHSEERPRSGSVVALHHALSISSLNTPPSPTLSRVAEPSPVDIGWTNAPPVLAPIKIKSKVTDFVKSTSTNAGDLVSRSLSPPYVTTRPIHTRSRTPSVTSFSLNDSPSSTFYPITTASPAANPHRYAPRRQPSPARSYPSPILSSEPHSAKKLTLIPKVDPALVPLPPHSPPISALSVSSKSSVSRAPMSLNGDQVTNSQILTIASHVKRRSIERIEPPNPYFSQVAIKTRDRSRSKERSPRDVLHRTESDTESEGSERQLKAEAKTNRKIADLEITNRSLLAINASLETTKNRQAKEIRDLRRKLRESRLILPPRAYKAVASALDDEDEDEDDSDVEGEDETFQRVRGLIDSLIESGKRALETQPEDLRANLATKVLNADELRSWRDSGQRISMRSGFMNKRDADDETTHSHSSPVVVAIADSGSASAAESDGEPVPESRGSPALPPITITHS